MWSRPLSIAVCGALALWSCGQSERGASTNGGGDSAATGGTTGTGAVGGDGGIGAGDCYWRAQCDGDTLEVVDWDPLPCNPMTQHCDDGCVATLGWAVCAIRCNGKLCPVVPAMSEIASSMPCCTPAGECGFTTTRGCLSFDLAVVPDSDCPVPAQPTVFTGCCLPGNVCGVTWADRPFGCVESDYAWSSAPPPVDCDGNSIELDAGLDADAGGLPDAG